MDVLLAAVAEQAPAPTGDAAASASAAGRLRALSAVDEAEAPASARQRRVVTRDASSDDSAGDAGRFVSEDHCWSRDREMRSSRTRCARRAPRSKARGSYFDGGRAGSVGGAFGRASRLRHASKVRSKA